jgi:hypothetical protein
MCECIRCNKSNHPIQNPPYKSPLRVKLWLRFSCLHRWIYCDAEGESLGKHPPPLPAVFLHAVPSRAEVGRAYTFKYMCTSTQCFIYRISQEEWSIFWEVIVLAILSKKSVYVRVLYRTVSEIELFHYTVQCTDEQNAISSHELQSGIMLTVEFSKMYYIR